MLCPSDAHAEIQDIVLNMKRQESTKYKRRRNVPLDAESLIEDSWRPTMLQWMYGVVDFCHLPRESVAAAAYFMDLAVSKGIVKSKARYQILAMAALHLSIKIYDSSLVKLESLVKLGRDLFTADDVSDMERELLDVTDWNVHPPTPGCFMHQFAQLIPSRVSEESQRTMQQVCEYVYQTAICEADFADFLPSTVAFGGMLLALDLMEGEISDSQKRCFVFNMACIAKLEIDDESVQEFLRVARPWLGKSGKLLSYLEEVGLCSARNEEKYCLYGNVGSTKQVEVSNSSNNSSSHNNTANKENHSGLQDEAKVLSPSSCDDRPSKDCAADGSAVSRTSPRQAAAIYA